MKSLDYNALEQEVIELIDKNRTIVLATCSQNRVTARTMSIVHKGLTMYFQTSKTSFKYGQIVENPHVALCAGNMQIEGAATPVGHPFAPENQFFAETYKKCHRGSYDTYSHLPSNVVIEVQPTFVTLWKYDAEGKPYREFLNILGKLAYREQYELE